MGVDSIPYYNGLAAGDCNQQVMCGRIYQTLPLHRLVSIARARMASNPSAYSSSYNVCPTTFIPAIRSNKRFVAQEPAVKEKPQQGIQMEEEKKQGVVVEEGNKEQSQYELSFSKWGLKTKHNLVTNCRAEEMFMKPTFTKLMKNRCVVIMQGYYEWNTKKEPYLFKSKTEDHVLVAGLYNDEEEVVILTRDAAPNLKSVHQRMPVILSPDDVKLWLDEENSNVITKIVEEVFLGKDKEIWESIETTKLAPHVNSIKEKSIKCIMTFEEYQKELDKNGIMKFFKKKEPQVETVGRDGEVLVMSGRKSEEGETATKTGGGSGEKESREMEDLKEQLQERIGKQEQEEKGKGEEQGDKKGDE